MGRELIPINDRERPRVFQLECIEEVDVRQNSLIVRERHTGMKGWKSFFGKDEIFAGRWDSQRQGPEIPIINYGWWVGSLSKVVDRKSERLSVNSG